MVAIPVSLVGVIALGLLLELVPGHALLLQIVVSLKNKQKEIEEEARGGTGGVNGCLPWLLGN